MEHTLTPTNDFPRGESLTTLATFFSVHIRTDYPLTSLAVSEYRIRTYSIILKKIVQHQIFLLFERVEIQNLADLRFLEKRSESPTSIQEDLA